MLSLRKVPWSYFLRLALIVGLWIFLALPSLVKNIATSESPTPRGIPCTAAAASQAAAAEDQEDIALDSEENANGDFSSDTPRWSRRLTSIRVDDMAGQPTVKIATTQAVRSTYSYLNKPNRMLLKIYDTLLTWKPTTRVVNQPPLRRIRAAQHAQDTWVVLDLTESVRWNRQTHKRGIILTLQNENSSKAITSPEIAVDPGEESLALAENSRRLTGARYQLVDIVAEDLGKKTRLTMTADGLVRYRVQREKDRKNLLITFYGAELSWQGGVVGLPLGAVRYVTAQQLRPGQEPAAQVRVQLRQVVPYVIYKDQNQVMLELDNPGTLGTGAARRGNLHTLISLDLENANLTSVLRALAQDAHFDLVLTPGAQNVTGTQALVTLTINEQPLVAILDFILRSRSMAYSVSGNTLRIGLASEFPTETRIFTLNNLDVKYSNLKESITSALTEGSNGKVVLDEYSNRLMVSAIPSDMHRIQTLIGNMDVQRRLLTQTFNLSYTQVKKVLPVIESQLSSLGNIKANETENTLIVRDLPGNMGNVSRLIRSLDTKAQQVMIEARIVEVFRSNEQDLGINWNASNDPQANPNWNLAIAPRAVGSAGRLTIGSVNSGVDINATLRALESKGIANTISNPRIATLNNQSATLTASQNIPYTTSMVSNGVVSNLVNYLELPITLTVIPQIMKDQQVLLNPLTLTVTTPIGTKDPPVTTTRSATTQMVVRDGETIAIGGMVRDEETIRESKVPLLGDLPLLGFLFRSNVTINNKVELVVFLTTHILE